LDRYRIAEGYDKLYHFVWDDLADWYLEASKAEPNVALLRRILADVLVLAHPFAPFVTETIWQTLEWTGNSLVARAAWPGILKSNSHQAKDFEEIKNIVTEARYIIKALHATDVTMYYTDVPFLAENAAIIERLAHLSGVVEVRDGMGVYLTQTSSRCWLDISADAANQYAVELEAKQQTAQKLIEQLEGRLKNKAYVAHAPRHVVNETKQQLADAQDLLKNITEEHRRFS
jgi:valyl-tRNA synthetase